MNNLNFRHFLAKYAEDLHTEEEHIRFIAAIKTLESDQVEELMLEYEQINQGKLAKTNPALYTSLEEKLDAIDNSKKTIPLKKLWGFSTSIAAAAVLFIGVLTALLFNLGKAPIKPSQETKTNNDFLPGSNKAILELANGTKIALSDSNSGQIAMQSGIKVIKKPNGMLVYEVLPSTSTQLAYNTITTPRGGQYQINLSDGTSVWLNASSSLTYPVSFKNMGSRNVQLTGEAYFEVAKDKTKAFTVTANGQKIEVLGTHFNVNAYADEPDMRTTLLEGSIKLTREGSNASKLLKPGQQSIIAPTSDEILIKEVDVEEAVAWKNGLFHFKKASIETVMRQLARWYDIDVDYQGKIPEKQLSGEIDRNVKASQVLDILNYADIKYKIKNRKITITP